MTKPTEDPPDTDLSDQALSAMSEEDQMEAMRAWFFANFEDPLNETPHDSEDGFLYVWGGPFDAADELEGRFGDIVAEDIIQQLVSELAVQNWEWAPTSSRHEVEPDEDEEDPLPADVPAEVYERYRALVAQHDQWMFEHPLPYVDQRATIVEIQRRLSQRLLPCERWKHRRNACAMLLQG